MGTMKIKANIVILIDICQFNYKSFEYRPNRMCLREWLRRIGMERNGIYHQPADCDSMVINGLSS